MDSDSFARLKLKLDVMRKERDGLNQIVLNERAKISKFDSEIQKIRAEYLRQKNVLEAKENALKRYNETIRESENAYYKLVSNTEKLLSALENEFSNIVQKFN